MEAKLASMITRDFNLTAVKQWQSGPVLAWRRPRSCLVIIRNYRSPTCLDYLAR